jgi:chromosomal replication initiation ATPase DnaA
MILAWLARVVMGAAMELIRMTLDRFPALRAIVYDTAREHGLSVRDIMSRERLAPTVAARHEAIRRVAAHVQWSPTNRPGKVWGAARIGRLFGRDHTTILHALDRLAPQAHNRHRKRTKAERRETTGAACGRG